MAHNALPYLHNLRGEIPSNTNPPKEFSRGIDRYDITCSSRHKYCALRAVAKQPACRNRIIEPM